LKPATRLAQIGDGDDSAIVPPIYATTMFGADSAAEFSELATRARHERFYTRYGNPTLALCERAIAELEGAETALVFGSGMAAIATSLLALLGRGDHVVAQQSLYGGTSSLLLNELPRLGIETTLVDQTDGDAFAAALRPETKVIVLESPTNPLLRLTDIAGVARLASRHGVMTLVDNTIATPLNQRPLELGADLVVHSATKSLGGHSDIIAGAVAGRVELVDRIWSLRILLGTALSPFEAWLLLRGLRTLDLRVERQNRTAGALSRALAADARVLRVHYPGFGGVLSFEVPGGLPAADAVIARLALAARAASLGGFRTLVVHPAAMWAGFLSGAQLADAGIPDGLIRVAVGLEDEADLIDDFGAALAAVTVAR
jgi:methionine-gamma-lyase